MINLNRSRKLAARPHTGCFLAVFLLAGLPALVTPLQAQNPPTYLFQIDASAVPGGLGFSPSFVALDRGNNVYVTDDNGNRIVKFTAGGTYLTQWGSFGGSDSQFSFPYGIAADSSNNVYVADFDNNRVEKFDHLGNYLTQWGSFGSGNGQFEDPLGIAVDSHDNVFVADFYNSRIEKFDSLGNYLAQWGSYGGGNGQFILPQGVAVDSSNNVYVVDNKNNRVEKFDDLGNYLTQWGGFGSGNGQFNGPLGIAVDSSNNVYVADSGNSRIEKFDSYGNYLTRWGSYGGGNGQFSGPNGVAVDGSGNSVYVTDYNNQRIQVFVYTLPPPQLTIIPFGPYVILTWPTNGTGTTLQSTVYLGASAVWNTNSPPPVVIGGQNVVINPISGFQRFYRLIADNPAAVKTAVTIAVTGYNLDVVVERTATGTDTAPYVMAFDALNGYAFYEAGLNVVTFAGGNPTTEGLPTGGAFISGVDGMTPFQFGPYNGNNVLYMNSSSPSATLGLAMPAPYNSLIILAASANGGGSGSFVINFADHTSSPPISFNAPDWFFNPGGALTHFGRIYLGAYNSFLTDDPSDNNPSLFPTSINLAALGLNTKPIASLTFTMPNGPRTSSATATGVFALSGFPAQ
jgi:DNA-binding beta-propeller fold protein YncE